MSKLPETLRSARVLAIIWQIQTAPRQWTRHRLAEHHEVSERTITDDLGIIRNGLRFEIVSARGQGYAFTNQTPRLPAVAYEPQEAMALILAALAGRQFAGTPDEALVSAITRLTAVIPRELRVMIDRLDDGERRNGEPTSSQLMAICMHGVAQSTSIDLSYRAASSGGEVTTRRVDPYEIVPYERSWQIAGYCHLRKSIRYFKVSRIQSAQPTTARFARPPAAVTDFLNAGWGIIRDADAPEEAVVLIFSGMAARWAEEDRGHPSQQTAWQADGTLRFSVQMQITDEFRRWVLRHGRMVRVEAPGHLRQWLADEAREMLRLAGEAYEGAAL